MNTEQFIERSIVIGMVVSTDYLREIKSIYSSSYLESSTARLIASWVWEYHQEYNKAPGKDMEGIFYAQLQKGGIAQEQAEDIAEVLESLSDECDREQFNVEYLVDRTREYFRKQKLEQFAESIKTDILAGDLIGAEGRALSYKPVIREGTNSIEPLSSPDRIMKAFQEQAKPLITFPKALGDFWNDQFTRDSLVAIMGPEKRGKTFWLLEIAMRSISSGCNVAFFQAGDMSEDQQLRRLCIYLSKKSNKKRYCDLLYLPVVDCLYNQTDTCKKKCRECDFGVFPSGWDLSSVTLEDLIRVRKENPEYEPCRNCKDMVGVPYITEREPVTPLTWEEAYAKVRTFRKRHKKRLKLSTYPNETLTISEIKSLLDVWEREDGFVPDVIVIDYADILAVDPDCSRLDWRNQNNKIWQRLRSLSQQKHCLVVTATQSAATSYTKDTIRLTDFSEDKRKYAHATAFYSLNQTAEEKKIGIMRIGELVVREDDFDQVRQVKVLQRLQIGRPVLGSYF